MVQPTSAQLITATPLKFIMPETATNISGMLESCGEREWVHSLDVSLGLLYLCLSVMGISENGYLFYQMYSTLKYRSNRSKASFFTLVSNLAAGDIIILTVPVWVTIHGLLNGRTILGDPGNAVTVLVVFLHSCCARISIIFVTFIALFRVVCVLAPLRIGRIFSIPRTLAASCLAWILVVVSSVYSFDGKVANAVYSRSAGLCVVVLKDKVNKSLSVAGQILAPFLAPGAITLLSLLYLLSFLLRLYRAKRDRHRNNQYRPARERDSLLMTIKLLLCFVIFYTPWYIDGGLEFFMDRDDPESLSWRVHRNITVESCFGGMYWHNLSLGGFLFVSAAANPFLYGQTLVHTDKKNTHRGLFQTLFFFLCKSYRKWSASRDDETENGISLQPSLTQPLPIPGVIAIKSKERNGLEQSEPSKHSLISETAPESTNNLLTTKSVPVLSPKLRNSLKHSNSKKHKSTSLYNKPSP